MPHEVAQTKSAACYNLAPEKLIKCADGTAAVYNQWHSGNISKFIAQAEKLGFVIDKFDKEN